MDYLASVTRGDQKRIEGIVFLFFSETYDELLLLTHAIDTEDYLTINSICHKLKSAFLILGITVLDNVFKEMEQLSSNTSSISNIKLLNRQVNLIFKQARIEMKFDS